MCALRTLRLLGPFRESRFPVLHFFPLGYACSHQLARPEHRASLTNAYQLKISPGLRTTSDAAFALTRFSGLLLQRKIDDRFVRDKSLQKSADIERRIDGERTFKRLIKFFTALK